MAFYSWNNLPTVVIYDVFRLLDKKDLINASTTCKNWRACLFHPRIWPVKSMTIDLVNISTYELRNNETISPLSTNNSRGQSQKINFHSKLIDAYNHQNNHNPKNHFNNQQRFSNYQQRFDERKISQKRQNHLINNSVNHDRYTSLPVKRRHQSPSSPRLPLKQASTSTASQNNIESQSSSKNNFYNFNSSKADYRHFLEKCGKFLTHVTIKFNAYESIDLQELIYTINILTHARARRSFVSPNKDDEYWFNNIESLVLKPIYIKTNLDKSSQINRTSHFNIKLQNQSNKRTENLNSELLLKVFDAIEKLIATNRSIRQLSLGCLEELLDYLPSLLNRLKNNVHVNQLVESLNLATIKLDPFYYPVHDVKFTWFTSFKNLIKLSIDYDYVSDDFIIQLATNCKKLKDLTLNIHGLDDQHPIVNSIAWNHFKQNLNLPDETCAVELTINLLHTNESPRELKEIVQNVTIPIVNFRAYFAFSSSNIANENPLKEILGVISTQQQSNLRQLTLVDELKQQDGVSMPRTTFSSMDENTLVMLAWRCRNLEELTLIGYELSEIDLLAITRLRGENLKQLHIPDCCIYLMNSKMLEDEGYYDEDKVFLDYVTSNSLRNQVISEIAKPLNRNWMPLDSSDLFTARQYYLNTMLN